MVHESCPPEGTWPLHGMQPRIIRLRRNVTELEQRLASLEQSVKDENLEQLGIGLCLQQEISKIDINGNSPKKWSPKKTSPHGTDRKDGHTVHSHSDKIEDVISCEFNKCNSIEMNNITSTENKVCSDESISNSSVGSTGKKRRQRNKNNKTRNSDECIDEPSSNLKPKTSDAKNIDEENNKSKMKREIVPKQDNIEIEDHPVKMKSKTKQTRNKQINYERKFRPTNKKNNKNSNNGKKKTVMNFSIDCSQPASDGILETSFLILYLKEKLKVEGKLKNFGNKLRIEENSEHVIKITATDMEFSKRYLKYLTKRFLKKNNLRDWLRVVSCPNDKNSYNLKYYKFSDPDESSDEDN